MQVIDYYGFVIIVSEARLKLKHDEDALKKLLYFLCRKFDGNNGVADAINSAVARNEQDIKNALKKFLIGRRMPYEKP